MTVDFIIVATLVGVIFLRNKTLIGLLVVIGSVTSEVFSILPFGALTLGFILSAYVARHALSFFNASSSVSILLAFMLGVGMHALSEISIFTFILNDIQWNIILRGSLFFLRETLLGATAIAIILGMRHALLTIQYALVEKKII